MEVNVPEQLEEPSRKGRAPYASQDIARESANVRVGIRQTSGDGFGNLGSVTEEGENDEPELARSPLERP